MELERRRVLRIGGAIAAGAGLTGLTACSGTGDTGQGGTTGEKHKGRISVWSWQGRPPR